MNAAVRSTLNNNVYHLKVIILGAGKSERFGDIKVLAKLLPKVTPKDSAKVLSSKEQQGRSATLLQHVIAQVSIALNKLNINPTSLHIATGRYHQQVSEFFGDQFSLIHCEDADLGLGHTIAQSVEKVCCADKNTSHIMIVLADQVALSSGEHIRLIEQSLETPNKIVCAEAKQEIMPPAVFPCQYFSDLVALQGDKGAKTLLHKNKSQLETVLIANAIIDIDTKKDLENWQLSKSILKV